MCLVVKQGLLPADSAKNKKSVLKSLRLLLMAWLGNRDIFLDFDEEDLIFRDLFGAVMRELSQQTDYHCVEESLHILGYFCHHGDHFIAQLNDLDLHDVLHSVLTISEQPKWVSRTLWIIQLILCDQLIYCERLVRDGDLFGKVIDCLNNSLDAQVHLQALTAVNSFILRDDCPHLVAKADQDHPGMLQGLVRRGLKSCSANGKALRQSLQSLHYLLVLDAKKQVCSGDRLVPRLEALEAD